MSDKVLASLAPTAVVCQEAVIQGDVTIGSGTVVHPRASIIADRGRIVIGENNIIEEQAIITNRGISSDQKDIFIGNNNVFEVGSQVFSSSIGDANIIEARAVLSPGTSVGSNCIIGLCVRVPSGQHIQDHTVLFGTTGDQRTQPASAETHLATHQRHLEILWKTLPKFHFLYKRSEAP